MSDIRVIPFLPEHIGQIDRPRHDAVTHVQAAGETYWHQLFLAGPAYTGMVGDLVIGSCGLMIMHRGVAQAWLVGSDHIARHPVCFHVLLKRGLAASQDDLGLHRIQCAVYEDVPRTWHKWIEALGFLFEAPMAAFGPNKQDAYLYARVRL